MPTKTKTTQGQLRSSTTAPQHASAEARLRALHGNAWFADPRPANRWGGPEGQRLLAEEQAKRAEEHARRVTALGAGAVAIKGVRYHAPTLEQASRVESWIEATYDTAEAAIDAFDAFRARPHAPGVMYALVSAAKLPSLPLEPQAAANEPMVDTSERSAA
jgi:hypothetical protein